MPKGLKETSGLIVISASVTESAANTFTDKQIDLQLNALDQEVFVVMGIDLDVDQPNLVAATDTQTAGSLSTTQRTSVGGISATNNLANGRITIQDNGVTAVVTEFSSDSAPSTQLDYLGIIATNDFYLNIQGSNNTGAKTMKARLYGYRARADAAIYAALVQSEVLS